MHGEVRAQELSAVPPDRHDPGRRLLQTYLTLARRREHLLAALLGGQLPRQWAHYPADDAIDSEGGFQWFYHSHSPEDRMAAAEHGHIHLFARRPLWSRRLQSGAEREFSAMCGKGRDEAPTRHLLAIGVDSKGVPCSLFTVNGWVTGDRMLNATLSLDLLSRLRLETSYQDVDAVIESVIQICFSEIESLMFERDARLRRSRKRLRLDDRGMEVLSECRIDLDSKLGL